MRRWASRDYGSHYPPLLAEFYRLVASLKLILEDGVLFDQVYENFTVIEGVTRHRLTLQRYREATLRAAKVAQILGENAGKLVCEVPRCGFDFADRYGELGVGYAHVHHLRPLAKMDTMGEKMDLSDLAIVCANCHAMIHRRGACRSLDSLIPRRVRKKRRE